MVSRKERFQQGIDAINASRGFDPLQKHKQVMDLRKGEEDFLQDLLGGGMMGNLIFIHFGTFALGELL